MTFYTEGFGRFVTSTTAPIATGWSDRCRVGISPTERTRLSRRTVNLGLGSQFSMLARNGPVSEGLRTMIDESSMLESDLAPFVALKSTTGRFQR